MLTKPSFMQFPDADKFLKANNSRSPDERPGSGELTIKVKLREVNKDGTALRVPDTFDCDCMFIMHFVTPQMHMDFQFIARQFLSHEQIQKNSYLNSDFTNKISRWNSPNILFEHYILGIILTSIRAGSVYARKFLITLYKNYYKPEYKQLRRFTVLKHTDILAMGGETGDAVYDDAVISRLLTMAPLLGIALDPMCIMLYSMMIRHLDFDQQEMYILKTPPVLSSEQMEQWRHSTKQTIAAVQRPFFQSHISRPSRIAQQFVGSIFKHLGYPEDYLLRCDPEFIEKLKENCFANMEISYAILKSLFPDTNFNLNDMQLYGFIFCLIQFICTQMNERFHSLKTLHGESDTDDFSELLDTFLDECQEISNSISVFKSENTTSAPEETTTVTPSKDTKISVDRETGTETEHVRIQELQNRLSRKNQAFAALKERYATLRTQMQEYEAATEQYENEHAELIALRNHMYQWTDNDIKEKNHDYSAMETAIASKRIVIIGGHSNWTGKLKQRFNNWSFVSPKSTSTIDKNIIDKADYVYFFSNCIQHGTYYRFIKSLREHKRSFGYIHSINLQNNILQIWKDVCA